MLILDYNSAFNTIRSMKRTVKLANLSVPTPTCNWILDFLIDRQSGEDGLTCLSSAKACIQDFAQLDTLCS